MCLKLLNALAMVNSVRIKYLSLKLTLNSFGILRVLSEVPRMFKGPGMEKSLEKITV